jgi:hypothetical protein
MHKGLHTSTGYSRQILMKLNFLEIFSKNTQIVNFVNIVQWEPNCSMRTDGRTGRQTDLTKLIVAFRNSANAPTDKVRCLTSYSSMETYSAKCPGILPDTNKLSYDINIRWYVYEMANKKQS